MSHTDEAYIEERYKDAESVSKDIIDNIKNIRTEYNIKPMYHETQYFLDCAVELCELTSDAAKYAYISDLDVDKFIDEYPWVGAGTQDCCDSLYSNYIDWQQDTPIEDRALASLSFLYDTQWQFRELYMCISDRVVEDALKGKVNSLENYLDVSRFEDALQQNKSNYMSKFKTSLSLAKSNILNCEPKRLTERVHFDITGRKAYFDATHPWNLDRNAGEPISSKLKAVLKKKTSAAKSALKKGLKMLIQVVGEEKTRSFINGDGFFIEGEHFNFKFSRYKHTQTLISMTALSGNGHIPFTLSLYDKHNTLLCDMCVYLSDTPIIDQIIAFSLFIKSGQELEIIEKANMFSRTDDFYKNALIQEVKKPVNNTTALGDFFAQHNDHLEEIVPWRARNHVKIRKALSNIVGMPVEKLAMFETFDQRIEEILYMKDIRDTQVMLFLEN